MLCKRCLEEIPQGQEIYKGTDEGGGVICKRCEESKSFTGLIFFSCVVFPAWIIIRILFVILYLLGKKGNPSGK